MNFDLAKRKIVRLVIICIGIMGISLCLFNIFIINNEFKETKVKEVVNQSNRLKDNLNNYFESIRNSAMLLVNSNNNDVDYNMRSQLDYLEGVRYYYFVSDSYKTEYFWNETAQDYTKSNIVEDMDSGVDGESWNVRDGNLVYTVNKLGYSIGINIDGAYIENLLTNDYGKVSIILGDTLIFGNNIDDESISNIFNSPEGTGSILNNKIVVYRRIVGDMSCVVLGDGIKLTKGIVLSFGGSAIFTIVALVVTIWLMHVEMRHIMKPYYSEYIRGTRVIEALSNCYFATMLVNLDNMSVDVVHIDDNNELNIDINDNEYNEFAKHLLDNIHPNYKESIERFIDCTSVIDRIHKNKFLQAECKTIENKWIRLTLSAVYESNITDSTSFVLAVTDINEEKGIVEQISYEAQHDKLTGCYNRTGMENIVSHITGRQPVGMIMLDIDKFKGINDGNGHDVGDAALSTLAMLLNHTFRRNSDFVIRQGGDEFIVLMIGASIEKYTDVRKMIDNINEVLRSPEKISRNNITLPKMSISAGVAYSVDGYSEQLAKNADIALYNTKTNGRSGCSLFKPVIGKHCDRVDVNSALDLFES